MEAHSTRINYQCSVLMFSKRKVQLGWNLFVCSIHSCLPRDTGSVLLPSCFPLSTLPRSVRGYLWPHYFICFMLVSFNAGMSHLWENVRIWSDGFITVLGVTGVTVLLTGKTGDVLCLLWEAFNFIRGKGFLEKKLSHSSQKP